MDPPARLPRQLPRLKTPFARAVVPVAAGIGFFALLGLITWLIAVAVSGNKEGITIGDKEFDVARADIIAERIRQQGPQLYADLKSTTGEQAVVLDHDPNAIDTDGYSLYFAYRADRGPACLVELDKTTRQLIDCDGALVKASDLEPAEPEAHVVVELTKRPEVKIQFVAAQPATTVATT